MPVLGIAQDYPKNSLVDWDLLSTPQLSAGGRRIHYAQGKTLGGSSALNTMTYHRGTSGSYKRWADLVGDQSYTFDRLLPYFKRTSTLTPPNLEKRKAPNATVLYDSTAFDNQLHGPLQVSWANWVDPTQSWLARALQAIGQAMSPKGFSSGTINGGAWVPTSIDPRDATRSTSKSSYLEAALQDKKARITVHLHSQASRILFDRNKKAQGVTVISNGQQYVISAKKEVLLSAGVFHSPQILQLSGMPTCFVRLARQADHCRYWTSGHPSRTVRECDFRSPRRGAEPARPNLLQCPSWHQRSKHWNIHRNT